MVSQTVPRRHLQPQPEPAASSLGVGWAHAWQRQGSQHLRAEGWHDSPRTLNHSFQGPARSPTMYDSPRWRRSSHSLAYPSAGAYLSPSQAARRMSPRYVDLVRAPPLPPPVAGPWGVAPCTGPAELTKSVRVPSAGGYPHAEGTLSVQKQIPNNFTKSAVTFPKHAFQRVGNEFPTKKVPEDIQKLHSPSLPLPVLVARDSCPSVVSLLGASPKGDLTITLRGAGGGGDMDARRRRGGGVTWTPAEGGGGGDMDARRRRGGG